MDSASSTDLPLAGSGRRRADATRNRTKVLDAAERLFARDGVEKVTMQDVAKEAGVGVGTLYRGFTDKAGLAMALLDERERAFQERMLSGPPPLGPGADPLDRLAAFVENYVALVIDQRELVLLSQTAAPGARFRSGAHDLWRTHCRHLLDLAGAPSPDIRADTLLAALSAEMLTHWLTDQNRPQEALTRDLSALARSLAT
ncbi:TetR/AcrR family transcriptional regulator [Actinomadura rupiterrae]|uniref:TetR/AcrR family transcriptional regulator n=1 Tax=Actinomadura rupiterrae TaxID=559627 RepID=UPI0020A2FEDF|nr:TetR/AcrR family transcriptional regulator [Actinomadura rupiterrae]MCP2340222.1 AcrR family transcriptional regulator [Actinomadura rupiterrae]